MRVIYEDLIPMSFRKSDGFYITGYGSMFLTQLEYPALRPLNNSIGISLPVWWGKN